MRNNTGWRSCLNSKHGTMKARANDKVEVTKISHPCTDICISACVLPAPVFECFD